ncbi:MAG TPA: SRPBCC domain-containing protein [Chitinophagaceae bacterium]|nr:SRPBCC domain-containing protein [Chitinophagaceae bacterium]
MNKNDQKQVHVSHTYNVSSETVFDAWVKPEIVSKWLFVGPTSEIVKAEIDSTVDGFFSILELEKTNGVYIDHYGKYLEIERPKKLVFTLSVPKHFPGETCVNIQIETTVNGCVLTFMQTGVSPAIVEKNWKDMLQQLDVVLTEMQAQSS